MIKLANAAVRRPVWALALAATAVILLGLVGLGVDHSLSPSVTIVPGTQSATADQLATARFGPTQLVPILLEGPKAQLNRQGPRLVRDLVERPHTRALSAWDAGTASAGLRPNAGAAMIVVSIDRTEKDAVRTDQGQIAALVRRDVSSPVRAYVTGQPSIDAALKSASISATRRAELIALIILFVLLLVGLRAPLAAALVTIVGAATVFAGFGVMALVGKVSATDPLALATASMTGLALGVGFSLMILDRFHQEEDAHPRAAALAAAEAVMTSGRTILLAGSGAVLALVLADVFGPTKVLASLGTGAVLCALLATGAAAVVVPAGLALFGNEINRWRLPVPGFLGRGWDRFLGTESLVRRHAVISGAVATALLAALAVPALALTTGPTNVKLLPTNNSARVAFTEVNRVMGPGWATPYNLVIVNPKGPITTTATLTALDRLQGKLAKDPAVSTVTGPGEFAATNKQLQVLPQSLTSSSKLISGAKVSLLQLVNGLGQAGSGAAQIQSGLVSASSGAGQLHSGSGQAQSGAAQLHSYLGQAESGSATLAAGLNQALAGATALKNGASQALAGSAQLTHGLAQAQGPVVAGQPSFKQLAALTASTSDGLTHVKGQADAAAAAVTSAQSALAGMTTGKTDPQYAAAVSALQQAESAVASLSDAVGTQTSNAATAASLAGVIASQAATLASGLTQLHNGAAQLQAGIEQLRGGNSQLATGIGRLSTGGGQLTSALGQLRTGAGALVSGLAQLTSGSGQLAGGLAGGVSPTGQLVNGLGVMQQSVAKFRGQLPSTAQLTQLNQQSPGLFNSGYFMLAAVQGAQPSDRNAATFAVNVANGGNAGQIVVISRYASTDPRSVALGGRLTRIATAFATTNHLQAAVGGPMGILSDYQQSAQDKLPWVILGVTLGLALFLGLALRAVLLPIVAVLFNLLTTAAAFGVLQLLFGGANPPLGGPGYIDPVSITEIFAAIFGLSVIFVILLLTRTEEAFRDGATLDKGLADAMRSTAAVSVGMGLLMLSVMITFATTPLIPIREIGVGVATAVLLDVLLLRPVLLPAAIEVIGRRGWWPTRVAGPRAPAAGGTCRADRAPPSHHSQEASMNPLSQTPLRPVAERATGAATLGEMVVSRRRARRRGRAALPARGRDDRDDLRRAHRAARAIARGLIAIGIEAGDRVSILGSTRAEWTLCDLGALCAGAVVAPIYHTNSPAECRARARRLGSAAGVLRGRCAGREDRRRSARTARSSSTSS